MLQKGGYHSVDDALTYSLHLTRSFCHSFIMTSQRRLLKLPSERLDAPCNKKNQSLNEEQFLAETFLLTESSWTFWHSRRLVSLSGFLTENRRKTEIYIARGKRKTHIHSQVWEEEEEKEKEEEEREKKEKEKKSQTHSKDTPQRRGRRNAAVNNNRRCKGRGERSHCKPNALLAMILREVLGKKRQCTTGQACLSHAEYSRIAVPGRRTYSRAVWFIEFSGPGQGFVV